MTCRPRIGREVLTRTSRPDPRSLRFTQVSTDKDGRYELTEQYVTDPRHDSVVVDVRLRSLDGGHYRLYALYADLTPNDIRDAARRYLVANGRTIVTLTGKETAR